MLLVLSGALGALLFGVTGWLGRRLSISWYGDAGRDDDGPALVALPAWAFIAAPAGVGLVLGIRGIAPLQGAMLLLAVLSLAVCAATDARTGMIPDLFTLGPLLAVLAVSLLRHEWMPLVGAAFAFAPFAAVAWASRGRGMGWGDVKLAALGGALVGLGGITVAVSVASLAAYAGAVAGRRAHRPIAFGPYLAASIGAALSLGAQV